MTPLPKLSIAEFLLAQTHVLPPAGKTWTLTDNSANPKTRTTTLELIGKRKALAVISFAQQAMPQNPQLEVWLNGVKKTVIALNPPAALPVTEATGPAFRSKSYSAIVPAQWMLPGVAFKVADSKYQTSAFLTTVMIGNHAEFTLNTLPFYVYGAAPGVNGVASLAQTQLPNAATQKEMFEKWPVSRLTVQKHAAGFLQWPYLVIEPRQGFTAYRALSKNDQKDGFATMSAVLKILQAIRSANGEGKTANVYYAPLMMVDNLGQYSPPGGGLGGGHRATGDHSYTGVFIHEVGHALSLPHQGTAYTQGKYPYLGGSLKGSVWGYDASKQNFLAPFVPSTSSRYVNCLTSPKGARVTDVQGRCVKLDPMWKGAGDQAASYVFATFSDFSTGQMQGNMNSMIYPDATAASGYSQWDAATRTRQPVTITTTNKGLYGFDMELPSQSNVPVYTIVLTLSHAPCVAGPGVVCNAAGLNTQLSQIYPPIAYTGNLRRVVDPTKPAQLAEIVPNTGLYPWFCRSRGAGSGGKGCDYTVKVSYADGTVWHGLLQGGFRTDPLQPPTAAYADPVNANSFKVWGINVPGGKAIAKIELLDTPQVWNGFPLKPRVLIAR